MSIDTTASSNLALVAKRIESDIRARGLQAGERYLSVADAALMLGVSPATAHRAMELLVSKRLLVRQQGRGTFVGEAVGKRKSAQPVRTVYILLAEDKEGVTGVDLDAMVSAIRRRVGAVSVQLSFVPAVGGVEFVRELIGTAQSTGQFAGVIPISCSREIYRYLSQIGGPMVVLGSLSADQRHIASVDVDYWQAGSLLAQYLVNRGHKRMALLVAGEGRPGDHAFFDGVSDALTRAQLPHNALAVRIFPRDFEAFRAQVRELLTKPDRPTGIICHSERMVGVVLAVAQDAGLSIPDDLELVFQGQVANSDERRFARVEPKMSFGKIAEIVADMLRQLSEGKPLEQQTVVIPVELRAASNDGAAE